MHPTHRAIEHIRADDVIYALRPTRLRRVLKKSSKVSDMILSMHERPTPTPFIRIKDAWSEWRAVTFCAPANGVALSN